MTPGEQRLAWLTSPRVLIGGLTGILIACALASSCVQVQPKAVTSAPPSAPPPTVSAPATPAVQAAPPVPTAAPAAPPPVLQVGVPYQAGNWDYTVLEVRREKTIWSQSPSFSKPGEYVASKTYGANAKGEYVIVGLQLKNVGRENFGLSTHDFALYDGSGVKYNAASVYAGDWDKALGYDGEVGFSDTRQMPPGVPGKYLIVFDVAPDAADLQLRLVQAGVNVPL